MQMRKTLAKVTPFSHKYLHHLVLSQIDKSSCHFFFLRTIAKVTSVLCDAHHYVTAKPSPRSWPSVSYQRSRQNMEIQFLSHKTQIAST